MQQRRVYTEERGNVAHAARDLGIQEGLLSKWKRKLQNAPERPFPGHWSEAVDGVQST